MARLNWKRASIGCDEAQDLLDEAWERIDYVTKMLSRADHPSRHWTESMFMASTLILNLLHWLKEPRA